jgi:penicillin-binding protein 2
MLQGFVGAVQQSGGTAAATFAGFPFDQLPVAGKTGTTSVTGHEPTAWFACFAPVTAPRYAMAVVIDQAGFGASAAAPVARDILQYSAVHPIPPLR